MPCQPGGSQPIGRQAAANRAPGRSLRNYTWVGCRFDRRSPNQVISKRLKVDAIVAARGDVCTKLHLNRGSENLVDEMLFLIAGLSPTATLRGIAATTADGFINYVKTAAALLVRDQPARLYKLLPDLRNATWVAHSLGLELHNINPSRHYIVEAFAPTRGLIDSVPPPLAPDSVEESAAKRPRSKTRKRGILKIKTEADELPLKTEIQIVFSDHESE
jgi:hypothetical protein